MKVSVIIPSRNRAKLLMERSLPSVLNQTFQDFEIIIINDASEEKYPEFDNPKIIPICNFNRMGLAFNRNLGADYAKGEYVVSLDDDNEFLPDFLEKTVTYLDSHPEFDAVGVGKNVIYPEGKVYQSPPKDDIYCSINDGFLIRKNVFNSIRCDESLTANEDADFGINFLQHFKLGKLDEPLMNVYGSAIINVTSYSDYSDYHLGGLIRFWLKNKDYLSKSPENYSYFQKQIGQMFLLASGRMKWFRYLYWLETKIKRYCQIWL